MFMSGELTGGIMSFLTDHRSESRFVMCIFVVKTDGAAFLLLLLFYLFSFIFISWRLINSHFSGFCHTLT